MSNPQPTPTELIQSAHQGANSALALAELCIRLVRGTFEEWLERDGPDAVRQLYAALPQDEYAQDVVGMDVDRAKGWLMNPHVGVVTVGNITASCAHEAAVQLADAVRFQCQEMEEDYGPLDGQAAWEALRESLRSLDPDHLHQCRTLIDIDYQLAIRRAKDEERQVKTGISGDQLLASGLLRGQQGHGAENATEAANGVRMAKPKKSTVKNEARTKIIAALSAYHGYDQEGCQNTEPIGNNQLARMARVSTSTVHLFFQKQFNGHTQYAKMCRRGASELFASLKMLRGEFAPHLLYGRTPPGEGRGRGDDDGFD